MDINPPGNHQLCVLVVLLTRPPPAPLSTPIPPINKGGTSSMGGERTVESRCKGDLSVNNEHEMDLQRGRGGEQARVWVGRSAAAEARRDSHAGSSGSVTPRNDRKRSLLCSSCCCFRTSPPPLTYTLSHLRFVSTVAPKVAHSTIAAALLTPRHQESHAPRPLLCPECNPDDREAADPDASTQTR